jgi:hypothetical protein
MLVDPFKADCPQAGSSRAYWIFAEEEAVRLQRGRQRLGTRGTRACRRMG